jgi:hypothetical protein
MPREMRKRSGLTLSETVVSVAIIGIMIAVAIPAVRVLQESMHSRGAKSMVGGALSAARALAAKHQKYAGIRFQYDPNGYNQYMIFILHDYPNLGLANGFHAIEGLKPIRLPEDQGVMDLHFADQPIDTLDSDVVLEDPNTIIDMTTFSVVFTPSGKLVIHKVRVRRTNPSDNIFNGVGIVAAGNAMFQEDGGSKSAEPWHEELSRSSFIIYDRREFEKVPWDTRWTDYLQGLDVFYINPYTGTIIE